VHTAIINDSPLGPIFLAASDLGLQRIVFGNADSLSGIKQLNGDLKMAVDQIMAYFSGELKVFTVRLDLSKLTDFQKRILEITRAIPFGEIRSYGELARQIGKPGASQAVGLVMKKNPMPLIIPCHRVVASDGRLHGYSAAQGLVTKAWLLSREGLRIVDQRLV
jgi:methylated-DNA-[protein]-cysteine S-methyltransferase